MGIPALFNFVQRFANKIASTREVVSIGFKLGGFYTSKQSHFNSSFVLDGHSFSVQFFWATFGCALPLETEQNNQPGQRI